MDKKRVLIITQEMTPYLNGTEMSEIAHHLPKYIQDKGNELRVLMPRFGTINERRHRLHEVVRLSGMNIILNDDDYPLIIKVASLPGARLQVYFLDNEDLFKRKHVFHDENEKFYDDNAERMVFFCKAALETVKKFQWPPDIIHCHGWMTSLIPMFIRTAYKNEPVFQNTKIIFSTYKGTFDGGISWSALNNSPMDVHELYIDSKNIIYAFGRGNYSGGDWGYDYGLFSYSIDEGNNWFINQNINNASLIGDVAFISDDVFYILGNFNNVIKFEKE